jgi:hypothetical protein
MIEVWDASSLLPHSVAIVPNTTFKNAPGSSMMIEVPLYEHPLAFKTPSDTFSSLSPDLCTTGNRLGVLHMRISHQTYQRSEIDARLCQIFAWNLSADGFAIREGTSAAHQSTGSILVKDYRDRLRLLDRIETRTDAITVSN